MIFITSFSFIEKLTFQISIYQQFFLMYAVLSKESFECPEKLMTGYVI